MIRASKLRATLIGLHREIHPHEHTLVDNRRHRQKNLVKMQANISYHYTIPPSRNGVHNVQLEVNSTHHASAPKTSTAACTAGSNRYRSMMTRLILTNQTFANIGGSNPLIIISTIAFPANKVLHY